MAYLVRNLAGEVVVPEVEHFQMPEGPDRRRRNLAEEGVVAEGEDAELRQVPKIDCQSSGEPRRHRAGEVESRHPARGDVAGDAAPLAVAPDGRVPAGEEIGRVGRDGALESEKRSKLAGRHGIRRRRRREDR